MCQALLGIGEDRPEARTQQALRTVQIPDKLEQIDFKELKDDLFRNLDIAPCLTREGTDGTELDASAREQTQEIQPEGSSSLSNLNPSAIGHDIDFDQLTKLPPPLLSQTSQADQGSIPEEPLPNFSQLVNSAADLQVPSYPFASDTGGFDFSDFTLDAPQASTSSRQATSSNGEQHRN